MYWSESPRNEQRDIHETASEYNIQSQYGNC